MSVRNTIDQIELSLENHIVQNQTEVYKLILKTRNIVFLDTCFITRSIYWGNKSHLSQAFIKLAGGKTKDDIVLVTTEMVLFELKDSESDALQKRNEEFFRELLDAGFTVVVLKEEEACENIGAYLNRSSFKWNEFFVEKLRENKANLTFLSRLLETDKIINFSNIFEDEFVIPSTKGFINSVIAGVESRKGPRDSLAEELIGIVIIFLFELIKDSKRNVIYFCSNDYAALCRMGKVVQETYSINFEKYIPLSIFTLAQYMVRERIIEDKDELLRLFENILAKKTKVFVEKKIPYHETEIEVSREELAELIFAGEIVQLRSKMKD